LTFSCCGSVAALALANCNEHMAEASILRPHSPTPSVTRACHRHFRFSVQNYHTEFLMFLRSSQPFFSRGLPGSTLLLRARLCTCRRVSE
jgi:hypothetical protein